MTEKPPLPIRLDCNGTTYNSFRNKIPVTCRDAATTGDVQQMRQDELSPKPEVSLAEAGAAMA